VLASVIQNLASNLYAMVSSSSVGHPQSDASRSGLRSWQEAIGQRLGRSATLALLLSPVGLLIISVSRLLIVSNYNPATALAIASSGGYADTLLGTVIPLIPAIMPYLALALLFFNRVILAILAFTAMVFVSPVAVGRSAVGRIVGRDWGYILHAPVIIVIVMALLALSVALLLAVELLGLGFNIFMRTLASIACVGLIILIVQLYSFSPTHNYDIELIRQPWLPAETITFASGQSFTGYVLSDEGGWLETLRNDDRAVSYYPDADVVRRQICDLRATPPTQPLVTFLPAKGNKALHTPLCGSIDPTRSRDDGRTSDRRPLAASASERRELQR
jgi:hypothetical protein